MENTLAIKLRRNFGELTNWAICSHQTLSDLPQPLVFHMLSPELIANSLQHTLTQQTMSSPTKPSPSSFMRTSSDRSFASRASTKSGATTSGVSQTAIHHSRTGSFADFVVKFSELTQDLATCSSMEQIKFPRDKQLQALHKNVKAPTWAVECECIEVEENDILQTAYELNRV